MKGLIFCYQTLSELEIVYKNIRDGVESSEYIKKCLSYLTLYNKGVPYPYTLVIFADDCFDDFDNLIVDKGIDIGNVDIYMLFGREYDVALMKPIVVRLL